MKTDFKAAMDKRTAIKPVSLYQPGKKPKSPQVDKTTSGQTDKTTSNSILCFK